MEGGAGIAILEGLECPADTGNRKPHKYSAQLCRRILAPAARLYATGVGTGEDMKEGKLNLFSEQKTVRDPFRTP
jgi:hypothetical protein